MQTVVFLTGRTAGGLFENFARVYAHAFERIGFEAVVVDFSQPNGMERLTAELEGKDIYFVFGFVAMMKDLEVDTAEGKRNFWDLANVPYIGAHWDPPSYFFDRHVNPGTGFASLYPFPEHYMLRKRLPGIKGLCGILPPSLFDFEPAENLDFKEKEQGKLFFLKNGNSPALLRELWRVKFPLSIFNALTEIGDALVARMHKEAAPNVDALVCEYFMANGFDIDAMFKLRIAFCVQLDDYVRRVKSTMMAEVLSDFPVEIQGINWEHMDFSGKKCTFVHGVDYQRSRDVMKSSLGIIDMSPNTSEGFHDRVLRTLGMHTLCITNRQQCITDTFGEDAPFMFDFDKESLRARIEDVLAHPKRYVEVGIETTKTFRKKYPEEIMAEYLIAVADQLRLGSLTQPVAGLQEYFVWPPKAKCVQ